MEYLAKEGEGTLDPVSLYFAYNYQNILVSEITILPLKVSQKLGNIFIILYD